MSALYLLNGINVNTPAQNCRGNGKTLGLVANGSYAGLYTYGDGVSVYLCGMQSMYNTPQGGTASSIKGWVRTSNSVGITSQASESGIMRDAVISTISNYVQFNSIIKY